MDWYSCGLGILLGALLVLSVQALAAEIQFRRRRRQEIKVPFCSLGMRERPLGVTDLLELEAHRQSHDQR